MTYSFASLFSVWRNRRQMTLTSAFAFSSLLQFVVWFEVYEEDQASYKYLT